MVSKDVLKILVSKLGQVFDKNIQIHLSDGNYHLPSVPEVNEILNDDDLNLTKYVSELMDCDDYALLLKAEFVVRQNMYRKENPYCFGEVWGEFPTPHAINLFIDNNHQVWFVEPQTDEIFPLNEKIKSIWMIKI